MKSTELRQRMAPLQHFKPTSEISQSVVAVSAEHVRCQSGFGYIDITVPLGGSGLSETLVNTAAFLGVVNSLPDGEVHFSVAGHALAWKCGNAKGKLAPVPTEPPHAPQFPKDPGVKVPEDFATALKLGALSCVKHRLGINGMNGVVIDSRHGPTTIMSCDRLTVSAAQMKSRLPVGGEVMYFGPQGAGCLADLVETGGRLYADKQGHAYYRGPSVVAKILSVDAFQEDLWAIYSDHQGTTSAALDPDRLKAFIRRAEALASEQMLVTVTMTIRDRRIVFAFEDAQQETEEFYILEGPEMPDTKPAFVAGSRMLKALAHVDSVMVDEIARHTIVLRGKKAGFYYIVGASGEK